jgi:hypothetical protein
MSLPAGTRSGALLTAPAKSSGLAQVVWKGLIAAQPGKTISVSRAVKERMLVVEIPFMTTL